MTGAEMLNKALSFCGYTDSQRFDKHALGAINSIYSDLYYTQSNEGFKPLKSIGEEIKLPERVLNDVMHYGVGMLLAQIVFDGDNQQICANIYNQKRRILTRNEKIKDVWSQKNDF